MKIGELFIELGLRDADFGKGMKEAERGVQQLQKASTQMAQVLDRTVVRAFQAATVAAAAFGAATLKVGAEFEQAITQVGAIAGATEAGFASLEGKARQLGATTMFSATEAATAMQDLARAGLSVNEILDASGPALLLAGSAGADMGQATKITAATLAQFGLQASDAGRISDVFSTALRKSLFDMESLTEAMKYAGTVGAGFGYSLEQTTAAVAMFRNLGLEGSMAGTNLRMALAAAAKPTAAAEKVLNKLGLTVQDVNPELHSFDEIMRAVGAAGMSTAEAIAVFGKRAGANVAQIARQFATGQTDFYDLLGALEDSAGSTEQLYGQMTNTVFAQSKIVLSALQELMLGTFDTFRGPLRDLLSELADTIAYVAQVFQRSSGEIAGGFEASLQGVTSWLRENREALAVAFVQAVQGVQQLGSTLAAMLPHLRTFAELLVASFAAAKVAAFTKVVVKFFATSTTGLLTLTAQIRAVMAQLVAATGGIYAIVAAIGTLVVVLGTLAFANTEAAMATERLRNAEATIEKERQARAVRDRARAAALHGEQQATIAGFQLQLQASGKLTNALDRQLSALAGLTAEQIDAGLAAGDLFQATIDGTEVVLDAATALELRNDELDAGAAAHAGEKAAIEESQQAQASLQRQIEDLQYAMQQRAKALEDGAREAQADALVLGKYGASVEEVRKREEELQAQLQVRVQQEGRLRQRQGEALNALAKREIGREVAANKTAAADEAAAASASNRNEVEDALLRATEARLRAQLGVERQLQEAGLEGDALAEIRLQRKVQELEAVFDTEIALLQQLKRDTQAVEAAKEKAVSDLRTAYQNERLAKQEADELEAQKRIADRVLQLQAQQALAGASTLQQIEADRLATLAELEGATAQQIAAVNAVYDAQRAATRKELAREIEILTAGENAKVLQLEDELAAKLAQLDDSMGAERLALEKYYAAQIAAARAEAAGEAADAVEAAGEEELTLTQRLRALVLAQLQGMVQDAAAAGAAFGAVLASGLAGKVAMKALQALRTGVQRTLQQMGKLAQQAGAAVRDALAGPIDRVRGLLGKLGDTRFGKRLSVAAQGAGKVLQALGRASLAVGAAVVAGMVKAGKAVARLGQGATEAVKAIGAAVGRAADALSTLTGFSFDVTGFTQDAAAADARRTELEGQLASGELSPEEQEAAQAELDSLPATMAEGAALAVQEMATGALSMVQALVEALPVVVQELSAQLPVVVAALAEAVPVIVQALVEAVPTVVQAVVTSVGAIVQALADSLPQLVQALVAQIPVLVQALADGLLALLPAVGEIIATLVQALPTLVEQILLQIPTILQAVVDSLGTVIDALVVAIPQLLQVVIDQLPTIVEALVQAVLELVAALLVALGDLVPAIIAMLPALIEAVLEAVVLVIEQLVQQLPVILEALLLMVAQLVTAVAQAIPGIIASVVRAIPTIISSLIALIPALIEGIVAALPALLEAILMNIPTLITALVTELIPALIASIPELMSALLIELPIALYEAAVSLAKGLGEAVSQALRKLVDFFKDVIKEIISLGAKKTDTFGDTPGAQRAGPGGMTARFAPGDYVIAAQNPVNALRQALDAAQGRLAGNITSSRLRAGSASLPGSDAAAVAMLQAAEALRGAAGPAGAQSLRVVVQAEGRVLDDALYRAGQRGAAPRLQQQLRGATVAAGVHVGFDRGSYTG